MAGCVGAGLADRIRRSRPGSGPTQNPKPALYPTTSGPFASSPRAIATGPMSSSDCWCATGCPHRRKRQPSIPRPAAGTGSPSAVRRSLPSRRCLDALVAGNEDAAIGGQRGHRPPRPGLAQIRHDPAVHAASPNARASSWSASPAGQSRSPCNSPSDWWARTCRAGYP